MGNKRMAMLVVMMVLVMGTILTETEAIGFQDCYVSCVVVCRNTEHGLKNLICPFKCIKDCIHPPSGGADPPMPPSELNLKELDEAHYFCKLGCATDRCVSASSSGDKDHSEKVSACMDSCSDTCSNNI